MRARRLALKGRTRLVFVTDCGNKRVDFCDGRAFWHGEFTSEHTYVARLINLSPPFQPHHGLVTHAAKLTLHFFRSSCSVSITCRLITFQSNSGMHHRSLSTVVSTRMAAFSALIVVVGMHRVAFARSSALVHACRLTKSRH